MENALLNVSDSLPCPNFDGFIENLNRQEMEWYDTFRVHITARVDALDFATMFDDGVRSLLPVDTIAAMIILAEGFGWGDAQVVNECRNDLRARHALAIRDASEIPSELQVNKFRALVESHRRLTGTDLMATLTERLTADKGPVIRLGSGRIMLWAMRVA